MFGLCLFLPCMDKQKVLFCLFRIRKAAEWGKNRRISRNLSQSLTYTATDFVLQNTVLRENFVVLLLSFVFHDIRWISDFKHNAWNSNAIILYYFLQANLIFSIMLKYLETGFINIHKTCSEDWNIRIVINTVVAERLARWYIIMHIAYCIIDL